MLQAMRTRHIWLTRNLVALWFVLFFACSFAHADTPNVQTNVAASHADALLTSPCHGQHDLGGASSDTCNALQNSPRNQQLSIGLDLALLLGLVLTFSPLAGLRRPLQFIWPRLHSPGLPTPIRKQLHRYNE